jgi:hypothetical protein
VSDGIVLVVLLTTAQISEPAAGALERAARDVLGADASISVVEDAPLRSDDDVLARAGAADGVVQISWDDEARAARLHCYLAHEQRWLDRTVSFDRSDADVERGRLLGFVIGSMLVPIKEDQARAFGSTVMRPPAVPRNTADTAPAVPLRVVPGRWLELSGNVTTGVQGSADALGVFLGLRLRIGSSFRFIGGVEGSFGEIEEAQATRMLVAGRLGLTWQPYEASTLGDLGFGVHGGLFLGWLGVTHLSEDDVVPDRQSRVLGGARGLVELALGLSGSASVFVGVGPTVVSGRTDLYTHANLAATIPVLWLTAEIGVRTAF